MSSTAQNKLFVGGLNVETTEDGLRNHFEQFGALDECVVVMHPQGRSRCFGFITYSTPEEAKAAMAAIPHVVEGHEVEVKRAISREEAHNPDIHANVKKIFVGGVKDHVEAENLIEYFSQFGTVEKAEIISDKLTGKKRGFGFVFFDDTDSATKAVLTRYHTIDGNKVEVKKALSKQEISATQRGGGGRGRGRPMHGYGGGRGGGGYGGGGGGYGGGYGGNYGGGYGYGGGYNGGGGGYGGYGGGYNEYDNQMGGGYSNGGEFGDGYGQQNSSYGAMKGSGGYSYRSGTPYSRGGYSRGGGGGGAAYGEY